MGISPKYGFNYNWRPDLPDHRDHVFGAVMAPAALPTTVDLRSGFPAAYNQQQLGSCHDDQTEVLTNTGWVKFVNLQGNELLASVSPETSELIYEQPSNLTRYHYDGDMVCADRQALNFKVTPNHKMLVRKWDESTRTLSTNFSLVDASTIGWYCGLMNRVVWHGAAMAVGHVEILPYTLSETSSVFGSGYTPHIRPPKEIPVNAWMNFLGLYLAEGTLLKPYRPGQYKIQIAATKEREKEFSRQVFLALGVTALELNDRFTFCDKQIYEELVNYGLMSVKAPHRFIPEFVFKQNADTIKALLAGHFAGDGCENDGLRAHYTSSKQLADDLQRLIFLSGDESHISSRPPRDSVMNDGREIHGNFPEYRVSVCERKSLAIRRKADISIKHYEGEVFCAEMPTYHTLVTRRGGVILISGNCTANAGAGAVEFDQIKQRIKIYMPSRLFIYYNERDLEGTVSSDAGASLRDCCKALNKWGTCPESEWPYNTNEFAVKPPAACYTDASKHLVTSYLSVGQNMTAIKTCLAAGFPIIFGFSVYDSFESAEVAATGIVPMPAATESLLGGHAVVCCGYNDSTKTVNGCPPQYVIVRNSWSPSWGIKGYFFMPYAYLVNPNLADDLWTLRVTQ